MKNPLFNNARGSASTLQFKPPFSFKDMTVSVFPLRANLSRLQAFCDQYLNQNSEEIRFQVYLPYVFLQILDYGKMSIEAANMGWVSQSEVAFCVPLRWMIKKDGNWQFYDWAVNCPFIYVDNELSMSTGREVYGWPKVLARMDPSINEWFRDPHAAQRVFDIQIADVVSSPKSAENKYSPFLSVHRQTAPNFLDTPPNLRGLFDPITSLPNMGLNMAKMALDSLQTFSGIALDSIGEGKAGPMLFNPQVFDRLLSSATFANWSNPATWDVNTKDLLWAMYPRMYMNTVNLKQFKDASAPQVACYQAITNSKMQFNSINGMGPLGQQNLAFGKIDGGYSINIHLSSDQLVVDALGLEVSSATSSIDDSTAVLEPVFPFWLKVDMNYTRGKTVTWRSKSSGWQPGNDIGDRDDNYRLRGSTPDDSPPLINPDQSDYNTSRAGAVQERGGPITLPNTTVRVLPLIADETVLDGFVQSYLNVEGEARFEAWGSQVYLIAYNYTDEGAIRHAGDLTANREVNFAVPVKQYHWFDDDEYDLTTEEGRAQRDREKLLSTALVCPFSYVDDAGVAITSSEVHGIPTMRSEVGSPPHTWMNASGPEAGQHLLVTSALVLPEIGVGAGAAHEQLLNVNTDDILPYTDEAGWRRLINRWGPVLVSNLRRKYKERGWRDEQFSEHDAFRHVRALALEVLSGKLSINNVTLKQFRDAWEPDQACYQAVVQGSKSIIALHEVHEINDPINVYITEYPTQPISRILGLIPKHRYAKDNIEVFEAIRPFWLRADIHEELGQTLYERVADTQWCVIDRPQQTVGWTTADRESLNRYISDPATYITWLRKERNRWVRKTLGAKRTKAQSSDKFVDDLLKQQEAGTIKDVQISSPESPRRIMAHYGTLNHIDRVHVPDLNTFLSSQRDDENETRFTQVKSGDLRHYIGQVSPSTIIESMLSRQWGRPHAHRKDYPAADYVAHVDSMGPVFDKQLFPVHERRGTYWPQSGDDRLESESARKGLCWQLWNDVWTLIQEAHDDRLKQIEQGKNADSATGKAPNRAADALPDPLVIPDEHYHKVVEMDDLGGYRAKAVSVLPEWFHAGTKEKPCEWTREKWLEVANTLRELVDWSHYRVPWNPTIRSLDRWRHVANNMHHQLGMLPVPDAAGKPGRRGEESVAPNVADVLADRIRQFGGG